MVRQNRLIASVIFGIISCVSISFAAENESLFSENTAAIFIDHAMEIHQEDPLDTARIEQAMTFLEAAGLLDSSSDQIPEKMLRIGTSASYDDLDYTNNIMWALNRYLNDRSDMEVASRALSYTLDQYNSRLDRETLLDQMLRRYNAANPVFASEIATQLGLLAVEKADMPSALNYLSGAYELNPYNQLAFSKLWELSLAQGESLTPSAEIIQLRTTLEVNPYDLDLAVQYADTLRQLQIYNAASDAYKYASEVHQFLYPNELLPDDIVQGWLLSCYHGDRLQTKCLGLTETYRNPKRLNLLLEAVAGKTLIKLGQAGKGNELLQSAAEKAEKILSADNSPDSVSPEYLAWFYSFILEQPEQSLAWSNRAFVADPNRRGVKAIFAYSLAINGQEDLAQQYAQPLKEADQIASLTAARALLTGDDKQAGLDALRNTVSMAPDSFVAEKTIQLLKDYESDYIAPDSLGAVQEDLESQFSGRTIPDFVTPSERYSVKLLFNGSDFLYGADFRGRLVIENTSDEVLVISDESFFFQGYLRVDAALEGGLNVQLPNVLSMRFRPSSPILPGGHLSVPLDLNRGRLKRLLMTYPQADVQIRFTAYLDPMISGTDKVTIRTKSVEPIQAQIHRRAVVLSRDFLLQRLDVLTKGQLGQKYKAASLFTGLLAEQKAVQLSGSKYKHVRVEQALLTGSVRKMLTDSDWKIRVHTLSCLLSLSVPLDGIIREVSENLNHDKWPVRLTALYLLAKAQPDTFSKVLDWTAQHDPDEINRRMAIAVGGRTPDPEPEPEPEPEPDQEPDQVPAELSE